MPGLTKVLVVDDEPSARLVCLETVRDCGYLALEASNCAEAERLCREQRPHVAILDYQLGDGDALSLMLRLYEIDPALAVIVLTAHGSIELAVESMRRGASHFLVKPVEPEVLSVILDRSLKEGLQHRQRRAYDTNRRRHSPNPFGGESAALQKLERMARRVCHGDGPVLLSGETGCGKGVLARWLHQHGPRAGEPFIELNCAGLKPEFLESELFGYKKGAFTGAIQSKQGLLQVADRGTLFLDELGDMDLGIQAKLLKVLEDFTFRPLGEVEDRRVDVRLIAATHRDLRAMVRRDQFRADLFFRIHTLRLVIPPLRDRRDDLPGLVRHFLSELGKKLGKPRLRITPHALAFLQRYSWPGNVRELRNALERAILMGEGETLDTPDFHFEEGWTEEPLPVASRIGAEQAKPPEGSPSAARSVPKTQSHRWVPTMAGSRSADRDADISQISTQREALPQDDQSQEEDLSQQAGEREWTQEELWQALRLELRDLIQGPWTHKDAPPLGRWIAEDLLRIAIGRTGGIQRQAATLLGVPHSTFNRRLQRAESSSTERLPRWDSIKALLEQLLCVAHPTSTDPGVDIRRILLEEIRSSGLKTGPALMGVSRPTYRSWQKTLREKPSKGEW